VECFQTREVSLFWSGRFWRVTGW